MSNHKEKPPQVKRGQYIHLPQDSIAEEPSPPEHHDSTGELTPSQEGYIELSRALEVAAEGATVQLEDESFTDFFDRCKRIASARSKHPSMVMGFYGKGADYLPPVKGEDYGRPYHPSGLDFEYWDKRAKDALDEAMAEAEAQDDADEGVNPKDLLGIKKPNLFLVPPAAEIYLALAMQDGAAKYGPFNWREKKVKASIYIAACKRHINKWVDGLENAEDSGMPELAHALACLAIIVDAYETGNLADDRPLPGSAAKLLAKWTKE